MANRNPAPTPNTNPTPTPNPDPGQIADLFDISNQPRTAIKWFKILNARVPTDPGVLARIGNIYLAP